MCNFVRLFIKRGSELLGHMMEASASSLLMSVSMCVLHNYVIKGPLCEIAPPIIQIWELTFHLVTQNANYVNALTRRVACLIQEV